jgi:hypothetical protein
VNTTPVSKVLVLDESPEHLQSIKEFCDENDLIALKAHRGSVMSVLRTNIDLGAILLAENYGGSLETAAQTAAEIHRTRPELPIIMHRESTDKLEGLAEPLRRAVCATYIAKDRTALRRIIKERIFCLTYPNALLRGIVEIMQSVLANQFAGARISIDTPYVVHDRIIFGELFSLMQLESTWCRGYMTLQTEEDPLLVLAGQPLGPTSLSFRTVNDFLGEITNLVWGALKNRYLGDPGATSGAQVPLIVNHKHRYISFGTSNPQLCFRLTLADAAGTCTTTLHARFVFNLSWSPEDFKEIPQKFAGLVESGELQLF